MVGHTPKAALLHTVTQRSWFSTIATYGLHPPHRREKREAQELDREVSPLQPGRPSRSPPFHSWAGTILLNCLWNEKYILLCLKRTRAQKHEEILGIFAWGVFGYQFPVYKPFLFNFANICTKGILHCALMVAPFWLLLDSLSCFWVFHLMSPGGRWGGTSCVISCYILTTALRGSDLHFSLPIF